MTQKYTIKNAEKLCEDFTELTHKALLLRRKAIKLSYNSRFFFGTYIGSFLGYIVFDHVVFMLFDCFMLSACFLWGYYTIAEHRVDTMILKSLKTILEIETEINLHIHNIKQGDVQLKLIKGRNENVQLLQKHFNSDG